MAILGCLHQENQIMGVAAWRKEQTSYKYKWRTGKLYKTDNNQTGGKMERRRMRGRGIERAANLPS